MADDAVAALVQMDQAVLDALPVGIYLCDSEGRIVRVNRAAIEMWGRQPSYFDSAPRFCGSFKVETLDGIAILPDATPMAHAVRSGARFDNVEAWVENPDGRRWVASVTIRPLFDARGRNSGAVNCFRDVTQDYERRQALLRQRKQFDLAMAASKMGTWRYTMADNICVYDENAQRLYGLAQADFLHDDEGVKAKFHPDDLDLMWSRIAKACATGGDGRYEVEYRVKQADGAWRWLSAWGFVEFEGSGETRRPVAITGASRDISALVEAGETQKLLISELNHRVKNLFAVVGGIVTLTARTATSAKALASALHGRLGALARAHELIQPGLRPQGAGVHTGVDLAGLIGQIFAPYSVSHFADRISVAGPVIALCPEAVTGMALIFHELATNAAKYGALHESGGTVSVTWRVNADILELSWREAGCRPRTADPQHKGFGSALLRRSIESQFGGAIAYSWNDDGLSIGMTAPLARVSERYQGADTL